MFPDMFSEDSGPEARQWLRKNRNPSALASNRFNTTQDAIRFVEELYSAGAVRVLIPEDSIHDETETGDESGPYTDALIVQLDLDRDSSELMRIHNEEAVREGFQEPWENDPMINEWLLFWWD